MNFLYLSLSFLFGLFAHLGYAQDSITTNNSFNGAWEAKMDNGTEALWIITDDHFSITYYQSDPAEFLYTAGGEYSRTNDDDITLSWEYHTKEQGLVGQEETFPVSVEKGKLDFYGTVWNRVDDGRPGELYGAWLITGRKKDNEMNTMTPGARKTMKILSGTKFQWIAYNSETGEFFGTGGGSYTTEEGKYTENIEFFSRDNDRVGASLVFDYDIKEGKWHHSGKSTKGDPIYEIWSTRQSLGI